jgi:hypothetical protein
VKPLEDLTNTDEPAIEVIPAIPADCRTLYIGGIMRRVK